MRVEYDDCLKRGKIRAFSRGRGLAPKELQAALFDLQRAKKSLEDGDYKWSTVQLYYSMFHSARALLYFKNLREHSHFCLIASVQALYVATKQIPSACVENLRKAKNLREEADYYDRWSKDGCQKFLNSAEDFLNKAQEIITRK